MIKKSHLLLSITCILTFTVNVAQALPVNGTGNVTPDIIFGDGNDNGSFTGETRNNIEVGLRGKQRYPAANTFNYDGVDTYTFNATVLNTNPSNRSVFNFEWSINVDQDGSSGDKLSDYGYLFSFDTDPTTGVSYTSFDPFNTPGFFDHALGDNLTLNGEGTVSTSNADLLANMSLYNVAQQSANLGFGYSIDPDLLGTYNFKMEVFELSTTTLLSSAEISVVVVPAPAVLGLMSIGLLGVGVATKRRNKKH